MFCIATAGSESLLLYHASYSWRGLRVSLHRPPSTPDLYSPCPLSPSMALFSAARSPAGAKPRRKKERKKRKSSNQCITSIKQAHAQRGGEQSPAWRRSRRRGDIERRPADSSGSDRESRHVSVIKPEGLHNTARAE